MTTIDDRIAAAEALAVRLEDACRFLVDADDTEGAVVAAPARHAGEAAVHAQERLEKCRAALAQARRPKGPMVTLEYVRGYEPAQPRQVEFIRRTEASVFVIWPGRTCEERYRLSNGCPAERVSRWAGYWRITAAELERIRAMPAGENEVSRALRKLEAKRS